jgi:thioredoxin reductase
MQAQMQTQMSEERDADVIVVGGGPAGIAAAVALRRRGVSRVTILERDEVAGGVPRHCGHPPFGMREFGRICTGPDYAKRLVALAHDEQVEIRAGTTVVAIEPGASLQIVSQAGRQRIAARRVVLATGVRETPRSARLTSGDRPMGILNTGALQAFVYLRGLVPFRRPLIVGTELVSMSALLTCSAAGIHPVGMVEASDRPTAFRPFALYPRLRRIPVYYGTQIAAIRGTRHVESVQLRRADGELKEVDCDGVLFTGSFVPEVALVRGSHLALDGGSGGPRIDQYGRCSDPAYFAAGNVLRAVETAGWSFREGRRIGESVADDLEGRLPAAARELQIERGGAVKLVVPQRICLPLDAAGLQDLQLRVDHKVRGVLTIRTGEQVIWSKRLTALPERRILVPIRELALPAGAGQIEISLVS